MSQSFFSFYPKTAIPLCLELLPERLLAVLARTMVLELNVARVQGLLQGETGAERFDSFVSRIRQPQVRLDLFREYPVLLRLAVTVLKNWEACCLEFLQRFCTDWLQIRDAFSPARDLGPLVGVRSNAGDYHRGGRSVWILEFSSGLKIVYKPKPMAADLHFQELLGWLNERGLSVPFRQLAVLDCGAYGWEEFMRPQGCSSREEVSRF